MAGFIVAAVVLLVLLMIFSAMAAARRRQLLETWAAENGLGFAPERRPDLDDRYPEFDCLRRGSSRYGYNLLRGDWRGRDFLGFDYHYATHSTNSKGQRTTHHHHFSCVLIGSSLPLRPLEIRPEGFWDKMKAVFGYDDIDFESAEFSRRFHVSSPDRKWAYDVLHARAIERLLAAPVFNLEMTEGCVLAWQKRRFAPEEFATAATIVSDLLDGLPDYLVEELQGGRA